MSALKLQINSREALDRLIGGDSQMEMELRSSIVHEFTSKHLKALVPVIESNFYQKLTRYIQDEILTNLTRNKVSFSGLGFNEKLAEIIRSESKIAFTKMVNDHLDQLVADAMSKYTEDFIASIFKQKFDKEINARALKLIQEKLRS